MRVQWTEKALLSFERTATYIFEYFGFTVKQRFAEKVAYKVQLLTTMPDMGKVESVLGEGGTEYRSVVVDGLSKIIYRTEREMLYIVAFWDTRREPAALKEELNLE